MARNEGREGPGVCAPIISTVHAMVWKENVHGSLNELTVMVVLLTRIYYTTDGSQRVLHERTILGGK